MTYDELNNYIKNYLENDKTQRALMITAPWGSGKSYYLKNSLCPFLLNNKLDYAVVSLYGITDLKDISKSIYLELRTKNIAFKSETANAIKIAGKTIVKGIASFFNVDLNQSENDLQKLYESIDLSSKLIILEDLERTSIDIIELLGFVNNLVEQDGAKVVLIANENEIVKYNYVTEDGKTKKNLTEDSSKYLKIKEKTVGDTIHFISDNQNTIKSIIELFKNDKFNELLKEKDENGYISFIRRINQQMTSQKCYNYRSILYACQKVDEVVKRLDDSFSLRFIENMFIGTIIYSIKINNGGSKEWDSPTLSSTGLGSYAYPLFKVMHDYIEGHVFNIEEFKYMQKIFSIAEEQGKTDEQLKIVYSYYISSEEELINALKAIKEKLKKDKGLAHNEYARIANYLISIKYTIGCEDVINDCMELMIQNAKQAIDKGEEINTFVTSGIQLSSQKEADELQTFINQISEYHKHSKGELYVLDYKVGSFEKLYDYLIKNKKNFINEGGFATKLDIEKTVDLLLRSDALEINNFRHVLGYIYASFSNIQDYFTCDITPLSELHSKLKATELEKIQIDRIQKLQIQWLIGQLQEIINRLGGNE